MNPSWQFLTYTMATGAPILGVVELDSKEGLDSEALFSGRCIEASPTSAIPTLQ